MTSPPYRIAFVMDQVAGHVTNAQNLKRVVDMDDEIDPVWGEVTYHRRDGRIEWIGEHVPVLPGHVLGVVRGVLEQRELFRRGPFDAVMTNTAIAHYQVKPLRAVPTLFDFDSTPVQLDAMEGYSEGPEPAPITKLKFALVRRLFRAAAVNQAWSEWARQSVVDDYGIDPARVVINPPGVDLERWRPPAHRGTDRDEVRVLFVGGDFRRKGGHDLLEWFRAVDDPRIRLDVVTREDVEPCDGMTVHHGLGPNSPQLMELYRHASVFTLPSRGECFGIATVEAMATGLPVVVTDVGGTADIVEDGGNGFIVPAGDPRRLGEALTALVTDLDRSAAMGRRSRELAVERFDLTRNAEVTLERLKALARGA